MKPVFSTGDVSKLLKLKEKDVRTYARQRAVGEQVEGRYRFDFGDLTVLRRCRDLIEEQAAHATSDKKGGDKKAGGLSHQRIARGLAALRHRLDGDRHLSALALLREGNRLKAEHAGIRWDAETGQAELPLPRPAGVVIPVPTPTPALISIDPAARGAGAGGGAEPSGTEPSAQAWFETAMTLEETDPQQSYQSYLRVLALEPEHFEAMINIGRLCAAAGFTDRAAAYFRMAIRVVPAEPVAHFNLGVTLHDMGEVGKAMQAYRMALIHDPQFADAHYNLAALLEQTGDRQGALQHMAAYRVASKSPLAP